MSFAKAAFAALVLALVVPLGTPAGAAVPAKADPPVVVLPAIKLTLTTANGKVHAYSVEVASTGDQQARGLMFRRAMPRSHGMIFPMAPPRPASFWMENTYLPLDIIFISAGEVLNITHGKPLSEDTLDSLGPASAVLELNAGESARIGLKPGDKVRYTLR